MGLDMYAYKTLDTIDSPVDFSVPTALELHYWRKHPNLHGWMQSLYSSRLRTFCGSNKTCLAGSCR